MKVIIAEKEEAGQRIAEILIPQYSEEILNGVRFFRKGDVVIIPARGHIINPTIAGIRTVRSIEELPLVTIKWTVKKENKARFEVFKKFLESSNEIIVATDWDREGEVIGYNIVNLCIGINDPNQINRAYFSSLTYEEITEAFENLKTMNEPLLTQGLARNIADLIVGLNLSKALTLVFKKEHKTLGQSIPLGRVQSPLLGYIKESVGVKIREEPYISSYTDTSTSYYINFGNEQHLVHLADEPSDNSIEIIDITETEKTQSQAEHLYNTDDMMKTSKINPETTMNIIESLYLKGYLTYPRTTSRYVRNIELLKRIETTIRQYQKLPESFIYQNTPVYPIEEAHPDAILLTPEGLEAYYKGLIKGRERFIASIILNRIIRSFAPPLKIKETTLKIKYNTKEGEKIENILWTTHIENIHEAISYVSEEIKTVPNIGKYPIIKIVSPKNTRSVLYSIFEPHIKVISDSELVSWMSEINIGTEATRPLFPSILKDDKHNYLDTSNLPTMLGEIVADLINNQLKISSELTAQLENEINKLKSLKELPSFTEKIVYVTRQYIEILSKASAPNLECPKSHKATLVNRIDKVTRRNVILLWCDICKKYYSL